MKNKDLKEIYNSRKLAFHYGFHESMMLGMLGEPWAGKNVLEIGCGEGHLASILAYAGAFVVGIDFAEAQIEKANEYYGNVPNVAFSCRHFRNGTAYDHYDIVVMQGVLEHLDKPWDDLKFILETLAPVVVLSVPYWNNPRGYIYHTLRLLFCAKMSLTDIHFFHRHEFEKFAAENGYVIENSCFTDKSWGHGQEMIDDLEQRIPKAVGIDGEKLKPLIAWMQSALQDGQWGSGATMGLRITKK